MLKRQPKGDCPPQGQTEPAEEMSEEVEEFLDEFTEDEPAEEETEEDEEEEEDELLPGEKKSWSARGRFNEGSAMRVENKAFIKN